MEPQSWFQVGRRLNGTRSRCKICTLESAKFAENERFWAKRQFEVQKLHFKLSGFPTGSDRWRTIKEYLKVQSDRSQTATGSANPILSFVQVPLAQLRKCLFCKRDLQKYGFGGECGMCRFCTYHSLWRNCCQKNWPQNSEIRRKWAILSKRTTWCRKIRPQVGVNLSHVQILHMCVLQLMQLVPFWN